MERERGRKVREVGTHERREPVSPRAPGSAAGLLLEADAGAGLRVADARTVAAVLRADALAGLRIRHPIALAGELVDVADQAAARLVEDEARGRRGARTVADAGAGIHVAAVV